MRYYKILIFSEGPFVGSRLLSCAMEISCPVPPSTAHCPLPASSLMSADTDKVGPVHDHVSPADQDQDHDRGVDLSFDSNMKKESSDSESVSDFSLKIKQECDLKHEKTRCQSPVTASPGGRLKIFQSKYKNILDPCIYQKTILTAP